MNDKFEIAMMVLIGVPVLGILMGGIYWLPAIYFTKSREPWLTMLLGVGLSITVLVIGFAIGLALAWILAAVAFANLLLLIRRCFGKLDHNIEYFGMVHALTLVGILCLGLFV